jgi:hypothetical protein
MSYMEVCASIAVDTRCSSDNASSCVALQLVVVLQ